MVNVPYTDPVSFEEHTATSDIYSYAVVQENLDDLYLNGNGIEQSNEEALKWYWAAAEQGCEEAQTKLGDMYLYDRGIKQSNKEAVKWYRDAAEKGHRMSQEKLAYSYRYWEGIKQSDEEAVKCCRTRF
ncbi:hypothetical protein G9A89_006797 [Geosiphon pyriformis]|nr:hypothetical protein G9A89_006797 [Geosiphon pyriformis]